MIDGRMCQVSAGEMQVLERMTGMGLVRRDPSDASIGSGNFTQGVPAFWFARAAEGSGAVERLLNPYEKSVWVQRAIKSISGPVSSVRLCFLDASEGEGSGIKGRPKVEGRRSNQKSKIRRVWTKRGVRHLARAGEESSEVDLPQVRTWLERPMRGLNYSDFVEASVGWLKMQECFWLLSDETFKPFPEAAKASSYPPVIVARPNLMRPVIENGELMGWVYTQPGGKMWQLLPEQVIQLRYWNPNNDWRGLGEYPSAHLAAEGDYLAGMFTRNLMANNGDFGGILVAKSGVPTNEQREQIIMDLRAKRAAQLRGEMRYTFVTGDIDVKDPKIVSVDQPFITQRLESRHEIAMAFGVPPSLFDVKAAYSIGSASDFFQLIITTCVPTGAKFCDALERLIERMTGQRVEVGLEWDEHPVMQTVRRERFEAVDKLWSKGMPMEAINDYLQLDMQPYEGWDVGYLPINVTPAAEAMEPEPEPSTNLNYAETGQDQDESDSGEPQEVKEMRRALGARIGNRQSAIAKGKTKRQKLWEGHMRSRRGTVKAYVSKVNRVLNEFRVKALRRLQEAHGKAFPPMEGASYVVKGLVDLIFDSKHFGAELVTALNPVTKSALQTAADQVREEIGVRDPWEFPPAKALEFITGRKQSVQGCGETVRSQLNTALEEGTKEGESIEQLSDRVRGVFNALAKGEAKRIAMTETSCAFGFSRHEAMSAAGVEYKSWLSSHGPNVREAHAEAEEQYSDEPIPIDEPFVVDGEELMYPGDPDGSPENVINCHCVQIAVRKPEGEAESEEDEE